MKVLVELVVLQKQGHHGHQNGGTVLRTLVKSVVFDGFRVFIIDTGHDIAGAAIEHDQMVDVRTSRGLILGYSTVVDGTDGTFTCTHHAVANGMDSFDYGAGECSLRCAAILGADFHLFICELIERLR